MHKFSSLVLIGILQVVPVTSFTGFAALRTGVRMLPHGRNSASVQKVRQVSASLCDQDAAFKPPRAKIHGSPGTEDADSVRQYATGRLPADLRRALPRIKSPSVRLDIYTRNLGYLGRAPGWGSQALRMHFHEGMEKLARIERLAMLFIQDQLRGSPLLIFSQVLDGLTRDANRVAGVKHRLFEQEVGVGFSALNPGLARVKLHVQPDLRNLESFKADGISYLQKMDARLKNTASIGVNMNGVPGQ